MKAIKLLIIFLLFTQRLYGLSITDDPASTEDSTAVAPYDDQAWAYPGNIRADDSSFAGITAAQYDTNDYSDALKCYGFDFSSIPASSTIDGVEVICHQIYWFAGDTACTLELLKLLDTSRAIVGDNASQIPYTFLSDSATHQTFGSSSSTWNNVLTDTWVKDADFGVVISVQAKAENTDFYIQYLQMTVYYTEPVSTITPQIVKGGINEKVRHCSVTSCPSKFELCSRQKLGIAEP